jgi:lactoylglutathione lyase
MPAVQPTIQIEAIHTIGVPVTDQHRGLRFYVDTFGFETRLDVPTAHGKRWTVVAPPRGTAVVALVAATEHQPAGVETGIRLTTRDADPAHAALLVDGVPPMLSFRDQDGKGLEIV